MIYNILEVANCHGGNKNYILDLINEFSTLNKKDLFGIKFQPFKYDEIAIPNYEWYPTYEKLFFTKDEWKIIIGEAFKTKDIWLDIFDIYGLEILNENFDSVKGIKLQSSILENIIIYNKLKTFNLNKLELILNVAGREIEEIKGILEKWKSLKFKKIYLEIGYQGYPTLLEDSGYSKIKKLKNLINEYNLDIVFADHLDGNTEDSILYPLAVGFSGDVKIIEKHIMSQEHETLYDNYSSLNIDKYLKYVELQKKYSETKEQIFINKKEKEYLEKTLQIPILKNDKKRGEILNLEKDFEFKRTNEQGLKTKELIKLIENRYVLNTDKTKGQTILKENLKKSNITAIIACRLKSSRLKKKALLKIGDLSSIELCIKNTLKFDEVTNVVLATSTEHEDLELKDYTYNDSVKFYQGNPEDVIKRYIDVVESLNSDIVVRITGDCPYISSDIYNIILKSHFEKGADYSTGVGACVGTNVEIINTEALKKVKYYFKNADYSEYMTWYFQNNPHVFNLNFVELPEKYKGEFRLTLDYQEDLDLFNQIEGYLKKENKEYKIVDVLEFLKNNPDIANINKHLTLKYKTDQELINTLNKVTKIEEL